MNIWIFNHYAIAPGSSGGTRHYDFSKRLVKNGINVKIFASSFEHQSMEERRIFDNQTKFLEESYNGVNYVWIKTFPYKANDWRRVINMLTYTFRVYKYSLKQKEKPDIIIGTLMHPLAALLGQIIAKKKKSLFYFEERDLWPQTLIDLGKFSKSNPVVWLLDKLELFLYKKAKRVIILFDKAVNYVEGRGIDKEKILYLPNGADLDRYKKPVEILPAEVEELFTRLSNKFIAIYTGAHGVANYLEKILDVAKILKVDNHNIHFLLVGDGPEKQRLIERKESEELDNVTFISPISKDLIPSVLKKADIGLISMMSVPIYKWGFSLNKMYDYMAAGLPIVILLEHYETVIEKYGLGERVSNPLEMAVSIDKFFNEKEYTLKISKKVQEYVEEYHSWEKQSKKLIDAIQEDIKKMS